MSEHQDREPRRRPTRAQKKRAVEVYEALAHELAEMSDARYTQLAIPLELQDQIDLTRRTRSPGARKRQIKYLAGVLRAQAEPSRAVIAGLRQQQVTHRTRQTVFHDLEDLRDRLCDADRAEVALDEVRQRWPGLDLDAIAHLATQAHERPDRRPRRAIFRLLREAEATASPGGPPPPGDARGA